MSTPADLGWGNPRTLTSTSCVSGEVWPGHMVTLRNADVQTVMQELVRELRAAGWKGPDTVLDEWGYERRLIRSAEAKYRAQGLTEAQWLKIATLDEWSLHAWGLALDLDTTVNPMLATRPADPQAHTTMPVAACQAIAARLGLEWGGSWTIPFDPQHWQVAVTPAQLHVIAARYRQDAPLGTADVDAVVQGVREMLIAGGALGDLNTWEAWMKINIAAPLAAVQIHPRLTLVNLAGEIAAAVKATIPVGREPTDAELDILAGRIVTSIPRLVFDGTLDVAPS